MMAAAATAACLVGLACTSDDGGSSATSTTTSQATGSTSSTASVPAPSEPTTTGPPATAPENGEGTDVAVNLLPPVARGTAAPFGGGVTAVVTKVDTVEAEAGIPGETAGNASAVTVEIRNDSNEPVDLSQVTVSATYGDAVPAIENTRAPSEQLEGSVAPGDRATGVYLFRVSPEQQDSLIVAVSAGFSADVLQFKV